MEERNAIVRRIFTVAAAKIGSRARLAVLLEVSYEELGRYMAGEAIPPDEVLHGAVELLLEELPRIRASFSDNAWRALGLPR